MKRRRAISLIEMVIAMTVSAVLLGVAIGLLHSMFRASSAAGHQSRSVRAIGRLADQFRRDVHQAVTIAPGKDGWQTLEMTLPAGAAVVYRMESGKLIRSEKVFGAANHEEQFAVAPQSTIAFETANGPQGQIVSLLLQSPGLTGPTLRIEAVASKDHRMASVKESTK